MPEVSPNGYQLDVVVLSHNHVDLLITCLNALYKYTRLPFHLIVVDYSTDLVPLYMNQFCKEHDNVTYIQSEKPYKNGNQMFNKALSFCKTEFLATVMNSIRVEPDWEIGGLQVMKANPKVGVIGFKCLVPDGRIESAGIKMQKWLPCDMGRDQPGHRLALIYESDAVQWAFAMLRKEAVAGNLTEEVFHGFRGWDDIDNCFAVKKAGWQIFYCGASVGYHEPRATRGDDSPQAYQENRENGIAFYKRWGFWDEFVKQNGEDAEIHLPPKPEVVAPKVEAKA